MVASHVTDRQTDGFVIAYSALSICCRARKINLNSLYWQLL